MKITVLIGKIFMYTIGGFFILMAIDVFSMDLTFWERLGGFLMSTIPGVVVILTTYFLRNKEKILGVLLILIAIFFFVFFRMYDFAESWGIFVTIFLPMVIFGTVFIIYDLKKTEL